MADELSEGDAAACALGRWPAHVFDVGAAGLDDPAVRNTRGTHALARAATEAQVDVLDLLLIKGHRSAFPLGHEVDAAARRLGLESGDPKGRTCVETQAAVDAGGKVVVGETRERSGHTTNLPGFKTPSGSKAALRRRMISIVFGGVPQAPTSRMKS